MRSFLAGYALHGASSELETVEDYWAPPSLQPWDPRPPCRCCLDLTHFSSSRVCPAGGPPRQGWGPSGPLASEREDQLGQARPEGRLLRTSFLKKSTLNNALFFCHALYPNFRCFVFYSDLLQIEEKKGKKKFFFWNCERFFLKKSLKKLQKSLSFKKTLIFHMGICLKMWMVISQKLDIKRFIKEKKLEEMHLEKGFFLKKIVWITIDTDVNILQTLLDPHSIFSLTKRPFYKKMFCFFFGFVEFFFKKIAQKCLPPRFLFSTPPWT